MDQIENRFTAPDWGLEKGEHGEISSQIVGKALTPFESNDDSNVVDIPAGSPDDPQLPERRFIPEAARAEILNLFKTFLDLAKRSDTAREALTTFFNVVRRDLGIPDNEFWMPSEDAMYFEKQKTPIAPEGMETVAVPSE